MHIVIHNIEYTNFLLWADNVVLFSNNEAVLKSLLQHLHEYCTESKLTINHDKSKCMIFNKTGRLIRTPFLLDRRRLENIRSSKYLGIVFTPSGEIKSVIDGLKAYWSLNGKLGICFNTYPQETIKLFDYLIKPILLYGSDFWGCLSLPKNNPIENLHLMFCKHLLGIHKSTTTTDGVLLELGRIPLHVFAKKVAIKNWERTSKCNSLLSASYNSAVNESLDWIAKIKQSLAEIFMFNYFANRDINLVHNKVYRRLADICFPTKSSNISRVDSKLRTYSQIKNNIGFKKYLSS